MLRRTLLAAAGSLAIAGCGGSGGGTAAQLEGAAFPAGVRAPGFALHDQAGQTVSLGAQRGKVVVLGFLWSDCRSCVLVAEQVRGAMDELGGMGYAKVLLVSTDRPADAKASVRRFLSGTGLAGRVAYLTGSEEELRPVWRAYHVAPAAGPNKQAAEAGITVLLIDKDGMERVGYGVEQIDPTALSHDIRLLEAG